MQPRSEGIMCRLKVRQAFLVLAVLVLEATARRECRQSQVGFDYMGTLSQTRNGLPCQPWSAQFPHEHNFTSAKSFPDAMVSDASNHCRSPDGDDNWFGPWCFTTDPDVRYQFCDVPRCSDFPECRNTEEGREYRGHISVTSLGRTCSTWPSGEGEENYCRNPDGRPEGPYCYVGADTELCSVPFCKPQMMCKRTQPGQEYSGPISVTQHGYTCQQWAAQYPHPHNHTDPAAFPDATMEDAANFCRNPGGESAKGLWCYTTHPDVVMDTCGIGLCRDCKLSDNGREYSGTVSVTTLGLPCQRWDMRGGVFSEPSRYPDVDVAAAANFCRNPDNSQGGTWCFTSPEGERGACDIPLCTGKSEDDFRPPMAKHVIHFGVDGLRPDCIAGAIGGAPNLLTRLASEGTHTLSRARTVLITNSGAGWGSTLYGADSETTGITSNSWYPPWRGVDQDISPVTGDVASLPCIFQHIKAQDPSIRTASFYDWPWIGRHSNFGYPGAVDKEVRMPPVYVITDELLMLEMKKYIKGLLESSTKSYTFFYTANVDAFGHAFSWCNFMYNLAVGQVDRQIGIILDVIEEAGMANDTMVIVNSDHGGLGFGHGRYTDSDIKIPMFLNGPGIKANYTFQRDVGNVDIAPTVAYALGLKQSPYWVGRPMYDAFEDDIK